MDGHRDPGLYIDTYISNNGHQYHQPENQYPPPSASGSNGNGSAKGTAEANFKCDFCPKSFTRKDHLVRHKANHSQQNHYCQTCGRAFKRLDLLQRHEKRQICTANDFPRPKRQQRSTSTDSADGEDDYEQHRPYTSSSQTYSNPQPSASSFFPDVQPTSVNMMGNTLDPNSASSMSDQSSHVLDLAPPPQTTGGTDADALFSTDTTDFSLGFGLWPPDDWESLFDGETQAAWMDPSLMTVDLPYQSLTPRMQESSERHQVSLANAALVAKIHIEYPTLHLDLKFVSESLALYWTHIAPTFPFIHRGTFELDEVPCEMVLMMIIVGSRNMPVKRDFSQTVASIRGKMVQHCGLEMPITTLQCFTLCHVYDTWYGTSDSQFIAQCLWPVMVAHSRKKGIGVVGKTDEDDPQEEGAWAVWAKDEERRRAVYCILLIDTQLSAFWNQHVSRQLSIFAHHAALPCLKAQWEAVTARDWFRACQAPKPPPDSSVAIKRRQQPGNLPGLHPEFQVSQISDGYATVVLETLAAENAKHHTLRPDMENCLAVEMALMGLMAIAWDCRTRGGMGIRFHEGVKHWRVIVMNAVIHLRAGWEGHIGHLGNCIEARDMRDTFAISIISILSDIPMLQVAAGATQVCGSPIGARQYADAKRRLRLWAKTEDAWTCVWQSMRYLRGTLYAEWGIYTPWAIFIATLASWAYITGSHPDVSVTFTTDNSQSATNCLGLLDYLLSCNTRVEPLDGLGDLVAQAASLIGGERVGGGGGGAMQKEMSELLWKLVTVHEKIEGKKRKESVY